ncbi:MULTISPECIES: BMP family ABC transporter substrate-binding protein [Eubacteriales]|uniref:BMP family ABC transporter substrate-binding protein n=1 Tax=Bittarella massiliensis (ex Durand et al. 2017) TaxID=1720313 RepID=A0AAQ1MDL8_9FIRM|nr:MULTISPECIES: BMP family ABC transporter substrate-binding protein [Eubacteriales]ERI97284.1 basic membrane protein [Clostridium sp. ATCC 29733]MZL69213.1 BMP family ABC transporter substrate-binding protein [Bittarella massiliensis (ex Durand et al. 2017)]SHG15075.1 nucleoside-binding protein [Bittarella massiliensis (ex Durand et al. 2017)]
MKKQMAIFLSLVTAGSILLTGCGDQKGASSKSGDGDSEIKSVAFVTGALGDKSFADLAWAGVKKAGEDYGIEAKAVEYGSDKAKITPTLLDTAEAYDIVIFTGNEFVEALERCYQDYPNTKFIGFDIDPDYDLKMENVFAITYMQHQGEFLAGALAQRMSSTGTIGCVMGMESVGINDFLVGYIQGSTHANPNGKVASSYIGSFSDTTKAKELALVQVQQNRADVLHQVAGGAGLGVFSACQEKGIWGIGVDADQREFFVDSQPQIADTILTSMTKRNDTSLYKTIGETIKGETPYGTKVKWGVKEGIIVLAENDYYQKNVPQETRDYIDGLEGEIAAGELKVETAYGMEQSRLVQLRDGVKP